MDENLYDEFGNYIGPDLEGSSEEDSEEEEEGEEEDDDDEGGGGEDEDGQVRYGSII